MAKLRRATGIWVVPETWARAKMAARQAHTTLQDYFDEALREKMDREQPKPS